MSVLEKIRPLEERDFDELDVLFGLKSEFKKPRQRWIEYLKLTKKGERLVYVAEIDKRVVAYGTLNYNSSYQPFKKSDIPEVQDLNVGKPYRRQGIASKLILALEKSAKKNGYKEVGIGVGMEPGYGAAQRLYVKMGYIPDGYGLTYKYKTVKFGKQYPADDDLVLFFTKSL